MELRHLRYFVAVAEELHFGRAAERLQMAQPPLSQQIQSLEEELGVRLLQRTKRHVELTEAGRAFLREARQVLEQAEQAVLVARRAARGEIGLLSVGFVGSSCYGTLPPILRRFRERYPDVQITLRELTATQQVQALRHQRIHVGILRPPIEDKGLQMETIRRETLIVALPAQHPLAARSRIALRELADEPFILFPPQYGPGFYHQIMGACLEAGFSPRVVQEAIEMQTIVSLVAAEIGIALVPASLSNLQRVGVIYRPLAGETPILEIALVWRPDDPAPALARFREIAREVASEGWQ
jgi:DNA-binding transcriptional LysR family regulator